MNNPWLIALVMYVALATISAMPVLLAIFGKVALHPGGPGFLESDRFSEPAKKALQDNFERLRGTLGFWKKQAETYRRLHYYCLCWTIPSAVIVPLLTQAVSDDPYSKWLLTVISAYSAILLATHRSFKVMENYRAFREGESSFYDTYRRLLDRPHTFGSTEADQVSKYMDEVENLRKLIRNAETDNTPSLEQAKSQMANEGATKPIS